VEESGAEEWVACFCEFELGGCYVDF